MASASTATATAFSTKTVSSVMVPSIPFRHTNHNTAILSTPSSSNTTSTVMANNKHNNKDNTNNVNLSLSSSNTTASIVASPFKLSKLNNNGSTSFATSSIFTKNPSYNKNSFESLSSTQQQANGIFQIDSSLSNKKMVEIKCQSSFKADCKMVQQQTSVGDSKDLKTLKQPEQQSRMSQLQPLPQIITIDENSNNSIKSTISSSSSSSNENSPKKKRRRAENERLMEDLLNIDSSFAASVTKIIQSSNSTKNSNQSDQNLVADENNVSSSMTNNCNTIDNCDGTPIIGQQKSTKSSQVNSGDCPALHLRPRRNIRPPQFTSGYYSSGSSSPIYLSPVKNVSSFYHHQNRFMKTTNNTQNLLNDTSSQLSKYLLDIKEQLSTTKVYVKNEQELDTKVEIKSVISIQQQKQSSDDQPKCRSKMISMDRYIRKDIDVSVFASLVTPNSLEMNKVYKYNYISLKIINVKPIRFVELIDQESKRRFTCPLLELITVDVQDRFQIEYMRGVFDDPNTSVASSLHLTVFLIGSYALKSKSLIHPINGSTTIINILKFRTSQRKIASQNVTATRNVKKRKLIGGAAGSSGSSFNNHEYPFVILVDSPNDLCMNFLMKKNHKVDLDDPEENLQEIISLDDPFIDLYHPINKNDGDSKIQISTKEDTSFCSMDEDWIPLVSYSEKWHPPKDPRELNRSLYIIQPCIPKFESSSRTVKMSSSSTSNVV